MAASHDQYEPRLRVKASGFGGSGYCIPTRRTADDKRYVVPGVTTVTGALDKGGVAQWAVNQTAAFAVHNIDSLLSRSEDQGFNMLRWYWKRTPDFDDPNVDVRDYHHGVLMDAAELGTLTHDWIADNVNGKFEPDLQRPEQVRMVEVFLDWKARHDIRVLLTESTVVGDGYAGTLDHIWEIKCLHEDPCLPGADERHVPTLVDVKTSRATREEHYAQLGALGAADTLMVEGNEDTPGASIYETTKWGKTYWSEDVLPDFSTYAILQVRPDDVDHTGTPVPAFCKLHHITNEVVDQAYELFRGALQVRHAQLNIKRLLKSQA